MQRQRNGNARYRSNTQLHLSANAAPTPRQRRANAAPTPG